MRRSCESSARVYDFGLQPTLNPGEFPAPLPFFSDYVFVNKMAVQRGVLERGDVITLWCVITLCPSPQHHRHHPHPAATPHTHSNRARGHSRTPRQTPLRAHAHGHMLRRSRYQERPFPLLWRRSPESDNTLLIKRVVALPSEWVLAKVSARTLCSGAT